MREHGYLEGTPGSYSLTDKGKMHGREEDHHAGVGGYSWYNRDWTTRTWDEEILAALADEMDNDQTASELTDASAGKNDLEEDGAAPSFMHIDSKDRHEEADATPPLWLSVAFLVGVVIAANPRARRWVSDTAKPRAMKMLRKANNSESAGATEDVEGVQEYVTDPPEPTPSD